MSSLRRAVLVVAMAVLAAPGAAGAATRMYVSTARAADGSASVSAYAFDGTTQVLDPFQLDVRRGGVVVATDTQPGFVVLAPALEAGDELVVTDTTTAVTRTVVYTGEPTLVAPSCGTAAFSGTRAEGSTVDVSAAGVPAVQVFGPGTTFAGSLAQPLALGAVVQASQARVVDPAFTVFDAVSAVVGGTCPAPPETPKQTTSVVPPAPPAPGPAAPAAPAPAPAVVPAPVADTVAPVGRVTVRTVKSVYKALRAGTFASRVAVGEAATITQTLAAGRAVVGTGRARAARAGTFTVRLKVSKSGRRRLAQAATTRLTLTTVLRDAAGNARTLPVRRLVARRPS
jgi:hypothetical protein